MTELGYYILKSTIVSGVFYLTYRLLFKKESFFVMNRFFLLGGLMFAYLFPFVQFPVSSETMQVIPVISTLQTTVNQFSFADEIMVTPTHPSTPVNTNRLLIVGIVGLISLLLLFRFLKHISNLVQTITSHEKIKKTDYTLVLINQKNTFSFFRYIFISPFVRDSNDGKRILTHELSHLKHLHSLDRLFLEVMNIVFWMNPFIYLYRKELEEVHEFQADRDATHKSESLSNYFHLVLQQASDPTLSPLMSPFSYQLIKKRIMMSTHKSNPIKKFVIIIPIVIASFIVFISGIIPTELTDKSTMLLEATNLPKSDKGNVNSIESQIDSITEKTFVLPIDPKLIKIVTGWGYRIHPVYKTKKLHQGVDYKVELNTPIFASQSGTISLIKDEKRGYGKRIEIIHSGGYTTLYAHLNSFNVKEGQKVNQGDIIGYVGNTGTSTAPHLHFEVHVHDKRINPMTVLPQKPEVGTNQISALGGDTEFSSPIRKEELKRVASGYGNRIHPILKVKKFHSGIDYVAPMNTEVLAIDNGTVRVVKNEFTPGKGYGRYIIIDHEDGFSSLYAQLSEYKVKKGQKVKTGDIIGLVGSSGISTGPHLHLELKKDGLHVDPANFIAIK
ncbi:MAG: peptidoglycan DD-metalloendopeptidase family protein [Marinilabiliaceae bacterium]|nr:peptidoglycan DD-metalloendopeptidase family protein [Marinilabiliaceae bacterium]